MDDPTFRATVTLNPNVAALLARLPDLDLADSWLVAGCLFQTLWNVQCGQPILKNIKDYDVFYFDADDLSYEAEDRVIQRVRGACRDLNIVVDVKNQARVHLWYRARFGRDCPVLKSCAQGINRFLVAGRCVALSCDGEQNVYAPYGLDDAVRGILRCNPAHCDEAAFKAKAASYQARWPHLTILK